MRIRLDEKISNPVVFIEDHDLVLAMHPTQDLTTALNHLEPQILDLVRHVFTSIFANDDCPRRMVCERDHLDIMPKHNGQL